MEDITTMWVAPAGGSNPEDLSYSCTAVEKSTFENRAERHGDGDLSAGEASHIHVSQHCICQLGR